MRQVANLAIAAAMAVALVLAGVVEADCPGVDHVTVTAGGWQIDEFYAAGTNNLLTVEFAVQTIEPGTHLYYYDGSWHQVTERTTVFGSKTKFTEGGAVTIIYTYGACGGEIQPHDD